MPEELKKNYISLTEASKLCKYSQEYLSLRARQGKLRAEKKDGVWMTTEEWLDDYVKKNQAEQIISPEKSVRQGHLKDNPLGKGLSLLANRHISFSLISALLFLMFVGGFMTADYLMQSYDTASADFLSVTIVDRSASIFSALKGGGKEIITLIKEVGKLIADSFVEQYELALKTLRISKEPDEVVDLKVAKKQPIPEQGEKQKEGIIVVPSTDRDEEVKQKIQDSFSDEVKIEIQDERSGVITPVFRDGDGDKYLYMMVPISEQN